MLQAQVLGVQAENVADSLTDDGYILSHDQRFQVANAAHDVSGASKQSLQQSAGQLALACCTQQ